jgi:hypothetical protein
MLYIPAIGLSFGLVLLWVAGLSRHASAWLTWLDLLAGLIAFGSATQFAESRRAGVVGWASLALGLFLLWIAALSTGGRSWLAWWTLVLACAFLLLAGLRSSQRGEMRTDASGRSRPRRLSYRRAAEERAG